MDTHSDNACKGSNEDEDEKEYVDDIRKEIKREGFQTEPFSPECQVLSEVGPSSQAIFRQCEKNPGHSAFIPVGHLKMEHLPQEFRSQEWMNEIKIYCDLTVKIFCNYTSPNRPDTYPNSPQPYPYSEYKNSRRIGRTGTGCISYGSIRKVQGPCPCKISGCGWNEYLKVIVGTATHVIFDDFEASSAVFECFYDSETDATNKQSRLLYGQRIKITDQLIRRDTDYCEVTCVSHDPNLLQRLVELNSKFPRPQYVHQPASLSSSSSSLAQGIIISHPHGLSKQISVGTIISSTIPKDLSIPTEIPHRFGPQAMYRYKHSYSKQKNDGRHLTPTDLNDEGSNDSSQTITCNNVEELPHQPFQNDRSTNSSKTSHQSVMNSCGNATSNKEIAASKSVFSAIMKPFQLIRNALKPTPLPMSIRPPDNFEIPPGTTFTLPLNSDFIFKYNSPRDPGQNFWVTFPPNTRLTFPDERGEICREQEVEFNWTGLHAYATKCLHYLTYDIATCPGSSGAPILQRVSSSLRPFLPHMGCLLDGSFNNRSGLNPVNNLFVR